MIDKMTTLAFSMYSNKGVYALFLGSGVSLPSGIPTGWAIVKDLTKKIALLQNENYENDSIEWYKKKYSTEPDYSDIIGQLAVTSTERQSLLLPYFTPDEKGDKEPTKAHRSIAKLIKEGYVKVVLTTNFDRLIEKALDDEHIEYQVIRDVSDISGAVPLVHSNCTIVKINGDYLDCRFRNTIDELAEYPEELNAYLHEIFNNFGLITCGWSAIWDKALVKLIRSCPNQRYTSVFTYINNCNAELSDLATFKRGQYIQIKNADSFFTELLEQVSALKGIDRNLPLSKEIAIERMKKYLSLGDEGIIRMNDLLVSEFDKAIEYYNSHLFYSDFPSKDVYDKAIEVANTANEIIIPLAILVIRWGNMKHEKLLIEQIRKLFDRNIEYPNNTTSYRVTIDFNHVGSVIVLYSLGVACVEFEKFNFIDKLFHIELRNQHYSGNRVFNSYVIDCFNEWLVDKTIFNSPTYVPFMNHVQRIVHNSYYSTLDENSYLPLFCIFERLLALYYGILSHINYNRAIGQIPIGTLQQRNMYNLSSSLRKDYDAFFNEVDAQKDNSEIIKQGMFKGSYTFYKTIKAKVDEFLENHRHGF